MLVDDREERMKEESEKLVRCEMNYVVACDFWKIKTLKVTLKEASPGRQGSRRKRAARVKVSHPHKSECSRLGSSLSTFTPLQSTHG